MTQPQNPVDPAELAIARARGREFIRALHLLPKREAAGIFEEIMLLAFGMKK